jgi:hypothetical protein
MSGIEVLGLQLELAPVLVVLGLGAVHGVNPAMGWLFAVGLGLQDKKGRAVWRALPPLALGHALSVAVVVGVAALIGQVVPINVLRWSVAALLFGFGAHRLLRGHRHPRYGGMRMKAHEMVVWSFLMASAHGAGLMVLPFVVGSDAAAHATADATAPQATHMAHEAATAHEATTSHAGHTAGEELTPRVTPAPGDAAKSRGSATSHAQHAGLVEGQLAGLLAALLHTASYLLVMGVIALVVYHWFGLRMLRTAWINLDVIWATALIATAFGTLLW